MIRVHAMQLNFKWRKIQKHVSITIIVSCVLWLINGEAWFLVRYLISYSFWYWFIHFSKCVHMFCGWDSTSNWNDHGSHKSVCQTQSTYFSSSSIFFFSLSLSLLCRSFMRSWKEKCIRLKVIIANKQHTYVDHDKCATNFRFFCFLFISISMTINSGAANVIIGHCQSVWFFIICFT